MVAKAKEQGYEGSMKKVDLEKLFSDELTNTEPEELPVEDPKPKKRSSWLCHPDDLSPLASTAMKRWMYDWIDPDWVATKEWVIELIMNLKIKHKLK